MAKSKPWNPLLPNSTKRSMTQSQILDLNEVEKSSAKEFSARSSEIEGKLKAITQQLDIIHSQDSTGKVQELEAEPISVSNSIHQKELQCTALKQELDSININTFTSRLKIEIKHLSKAKSANSSEEYPTCLRLRSGARRSRS